MANTVRAARFLEPYVDLRHLPDGRHAELLQSVTFIDDTGAPHTAHKGEVIDGLSIPSWLWSGRLASPYTRYPRPACIHDHDCAAVALILLERHNETLYKAARKAADKRFLRMLEVVDRSRLPPKYPAYRRLIDRYRRRKFYRGVRVGARHQLAKWRRTGLIENMEPPAGQ